MIVLGIESTAHTLGIGICKNNKILSNVYSYYKPPAAQGILPREAADHHANSFHQVLRESLEKANITLDDIELIAFAQGPGIGAPLKVGVTAAKYMAAKYNKKIIGVNHAYAHLKISEHLTKLRKPLFLYLSGGNSQIIIEEKSNIKVLGETLDIGIGNLFDSFAREIKLEHAHGSALEKFAEGGKYIELPYSVKGLNLVYSGLLTSAIKALEKNNAKDVAYSLMETAFSSTCEATERALFLTKKKKLVVCGGVAQNKRLQEMLRKMCEENGIKFGVAPDEFNRDNGAMIAYAGFLLYKKYGKKIKNIKIKDWEAKQNYRVDETYSFFNEYYKN